MTADPDDPAPGTADADAGDSRDTGRSNGGEDGYVHRPRGAPRRRAPTPEDGFDWRGWLLVGAIVVVFLVIPAIILLLPHATGILEPLGLGLRDVYLVGPLLSAFLFGVLAVWAAVRSRSQ